MLEAISWVPCKEPRSGILECLPGKSKGHAAGSSLQDLLLGMIAMAVSAFQDSVRRNIVRRSSLEEANRIYQALTRESTLKDEDPLPSSGKPYPFIVPSTMKSTLGSPVRFQNHPVFAFANTVAGIGMVVSAQWELVLGNSFGYTALRFFYCGFSAILTPLFGVKESYGDDTIGYNNALGFWVLMWAVLNLFFVFGAMAINLVYFGFFFFVELAFALIAASYFAAADGKADESNALPSRFREACSRFWLGFLVTTRLHT
ncbi:Acetate transporter protein patA [Lachnellula arida]|uniref:Acetate transporter protein patA n=1 Tax=Lachnellula arida TaxID=1316785 RepID=A0A8T9BDE5_9HELO|nr:Acetate transporter protein patA [Lachnellula arida]